MDIFSKINKISEGLEETDKAIVNQWEDELRQLGVMIDVVNIQPIKELIERLANKVAENKKRLSEDSKLAQAERDMLFAECKVYNEVLNYFLSAKNYAQNLEKQIEDTFNSLEK
jgi:hypothetical protein